MRYELMLPHHVRAAIDGHWPVVLPLGVMEYHGEHMALGMDTIAVVKVLERFEAERDIVVLPTFTYGSGTYAVAPPERSGSLQVNPDELTPMATGLFRSLLRVGFRNIHFVIHHQTENFEVGMPTDLAFKFAARQAIFTFLSETRGEGWWGDDAMRGYYADQKQGLDPFNWIKGHPLMDATMLGRYSFDHAGIGETSLMLALCPEAVDWSRLGENVKWFTGSAPEATAELGEQGVAMILEHLRKVLV